MAMPLTRYPAADGHPYPATIHWKHLERVPITYTKPKEPEKPQRGQASAHQPQSEYIPWYKEEEVFQIKVNEILLTEKAHHYAKNIQLPKHLVYYLNNPEVKLLPIAVRRLEDGKYSLVTGIQRYFVAKIMGLEQVPAVETELSHDAFMREHGWVERPTPAVGKK